DAKGIAAHGIRVDAISMNGKLDGQNVSISEFTATSGENRITGSARAILKPGAAGIEGSPDMDVQITAPRLEQFGVVVNGAALNGSVTAKGNLRLDGKQLTGNLQGNGTGLLLGKTPLGGFRAQVKLENGAAILESLILTVADAGEVTATGRVALNAPMRYTGELHGAFANLGKLDAISAAIGHRAKLGGALTFDWSGDGRISEKVHTGKLKVAGKNLRHDALLLNEVRLGVAYSPTQFDTDEFLVLADKAKLAGRIHWSDGRLDLSELSVAMGREEIVKGEASIALDLANPNNLLPTDQPLTAQLVCKSADLGQLLASAGIAAPVTGKLSFDLAAGGTLSKPDVKLTVAGRAMKSSRAASLAPADLDATLWVRDSRITLDAVGRQRDIQPFTIIASLPFDFEKLRGRPELARETPLEAVVKLPATSLGIVPRFVPAIARLDGTVAANVEVHGTFAKPIVSGEVSIATKSIRLAAGAVPPVSNFRSKLNFHDSTITFRDTRGEIGGGTFNVDGSVNVASLAQPALDLRLRSNKVLVLRDESITVRADADVTVRGPLNSATAAGTVFVTQSRFLKDVDILPLTLPGKPKPQVRSVAAPQRVSFPSPPLRDWKFDIAIKSRENDPFLIRGNLAKGSIAMDLRLGGTGLNPFLTGYAQIDSFTAVLPVSKLEVQRGYITFSEDDPFQPQIDIQSQSVIGKTTVYANISGSARAPRLELESEPPLPQKDVISLIATGTTSGEIGSNASALASKAALITVKRWYRKTFKKGVNEPAVDEPSFINRFDVDISNVDPKTGRPQVDASVRFTDNLFFLGEIDVGGQFSGKMKYLLRFR
ncbi:MAG: translocation/assembly module TamB domain-containing protein, partial [Chthoniobacteraceae bacterium]